MKYRIESRLFGKHVVYACPICNAVLESPIKDAGGTDFCPTCSATLVVPGETERKANESASTKLKPTQRRTITAVVLTLMAGAGIFVLLTKIYFDRLQTSQATSVPTVSASDLQPAPPTHADPGPTPTDSESKNDSPSDVIEDNPAAADVGWLVSPRTIRRGDIEVTAIKANISPVLESSDLDLRIIEAALGNESDSPPDWDQIIGDLADHKETEKCFAIVFEIVNTSSTKKYSYPAWSTTREEVAIDEFGNSYWSTQLFPYTALMLAGQRDKEELDDSELYPGDKRLAFVSIKRPVDAARQLTATLPGYYLDSKNDLVFTFERTEPKPLPAPPGHTAPKPDAPEPAATKPSEQENEPAPPPRSFTGIGLTVADCERIWPVAAGWEWKRLVDRDDYSWVDDKTTDDTTPGAWRGHCGRKDAPSLYLRGYNNDVLLFEATSYISPEDGPEVKRRALAEPFEYCARATRTDMSKLQQWIAKFKQGILDGKMLSVIEIDGLRWTAEMEGPGFLSFSDRSSVEVSVERVTTEPTLE